MIGGINGSFWATPVLELEMDDNSVIKIDCYYETTTE